MPETGEHQRLSSDDETTTKQRRSSSSGKREKQIKINKFIYFLILFSI
jgi:hypothetical protein